MQHHGPVPPELIADPKKLLAMSKERYEKFEKPQTRGRELGGKQYWSWEHHKLLVEHAGGSQAALICAIAYRSYALQWDSVTIAESLGPGCWPHTVRQHLYHLNEVAAKLGYPLASRISWRRGKHRDGTPILPKPPRRKMTDEIRAAKQKVWNDRARHKYLDFCKRGAAVLGISVEAYKNLIRKPGRVIGPSSD